MGLRTSKMLVAPFWNSPSLSGSNGVERYRTDLPARESPMYKSGCHIYVVATNVGNTDSRAGTGQSFGLREKNVSATSATKEFGKIGLGSLREYYRSGWLSQRRVRKIVRRQAWVCFGGQVMRSIAVQCSIEHRLRDVERFDCSKIDEGSWSLPRTQMVVRDGSTVFVLQRFLMRTNDGVSRCKVAMSTFEAIAIGIAAGLTDGRLKLVIVCPTNGHFAKRIIW